MKIYRVLRKFHKKNICTNVVAMDILFVVFNKIYRGKILKKYIFVLGKYSILNIRNKVIYLNNCRFHLF